MVLACTSSVVYLWSSESEPRIFKGLTLSRPIFNKKFLTESIIPLVNLLPPLPKQGFVKKKLTECPPPTPPPTKFFRDSWTLPWLKTWVWQDHGLKVITVLQIVIYHYIVTVHCSIETSKYDLPVSWSAARCCGNDPVWKHLDLYWFLQSSSLLVFTIIFLLQLW